MKIERCPYCGSDYGLFSRECVTYDQYYKFSGEPDGYGDSDTYGFTNSRKTRPLYCIKCGKKVTTLEKLTDGEER